jgi:hypothetical protein
VATLEKLHQNMPFDASNDGVKIKYTTQYIIKKSPNTSFIILINRAPSCFGSESQTIKKAKVPASIPEPQSV